MKMKMKMKKSESTIQKEIVVWSRKMAATGKIPELDTLYSNLTGAYLSGRGFQWGVLVAEGALAGIPDLHLPVPSPHGRWNSLYIEVKRPKEGLNKDQERVIPMLKKRNNHVVIVRSLYDFQRELALYLDIKLELDI